MSNLLYHFAFLSRLYRQKESFENAKFSEMKPSSLSQIKSSNWQKTRYNIPESLIKKMRHVTYVVRAQKWSMGGLSARAETQVDW